MGARAALLLGLLAAAALAAPAARAEAGRTPVWAKTTLSAPGHYVLTRDLSDVPPVVTITSPDVVLDLDGHTITATDATNAAVLVTPPAASSGSIEIRRGRVRGGSRAVWHSGPSDLSKVWLLLEELDLSTQGDSPLVVQSALFAEVVRCSVHDSPGIAPAIWIEALYQPKITAVITGNVVSSVGGPGIQVDRLGGGVIRDNVVRGWGTTIPSTAISIDGAGSNLGGAIIAGNAVHGESATPSGRGIVVSGQAHRTAVRNNVVTGAVEYGIEVHSNGNGLTANVVRVTGPRGIGLYGHDNLVEANQITRSSGDGIVVSGSANLLEANTASGNGGMGITFLGVDNAYRKNVLRNNTSGAVDGWAIDGGGNIP
jgi:parallel beta-helix repeat protein